MKPRKDSAWARPAAHLIAVLGLAIGVAASTLAAEHVELLQDINVGPASSGPLGFVKMGDYIYFRAAATAFDYELWRTDGTESGATLVADIRVGPEPSSPNLLTVVNDTLFFTANDGIHGGELWKSDGTDAGTEMVADIAPPGSFQSPWFLTDVNGVLYFTADDGVQGRELWKSDGTTGGTSVVAPDLADDSFYGSPRQLTVMDGTLYFVVDDRVHGHELYKVESGQQPVLVKDINNSPSSSIQVGTELAVVNGYLYFSACDASLDCELWRTDGTEQGTERVKDICAAPTTEPGCFCGDLPVPGQIFTSSNPHNLTPVGDTLFFTACSLDSGQGLRLGLWKSDGTDGGTVPVKGIANGSRIPPLGEFAALNQMLYFVAFGPAQEGAPQSIGRELWRSDGSEEGTYPLKDICRGDSGGCGPGPADEPSISSNPGQLASLGGSLYFSAYSDDTEVGSVEHVGRELWKSDGTSEGTVLVKDICRPALGCGFGSSYPAGLTAIDGALYFQAYDNVVGVELWRLGPPSPQEGIKNIIKNVQDLVDQGILNRGQGNGLIAKLEAALAQIDRGNPGPTIHQLEAFVNQVTALMNSGSLTVEQGQPLIDQALEVISLLEP